MQLKYHRVQLKYKDTFTIARASRQTQENLIVELQDGVHRGYGEAAAHKYYQVDVEQLIAQLQELNNEIEQVSWSHPQEFEMFLQQRLPDTPFLRCALDEAANDLWAKKQGKPLYEALGLSIQQPLPLSNYTIGIDTPANMVAKLKAVPWPVYKIKLGTEYDLTILRELRNHTTAPFRVDSNEAWSASQTIEYAEILKSLNVEFIEQPLSHTNDEQMKSVFEQSCLPIAADESCRVEADIARCVGKFHIINIKLMKCGGITPALRMIEKARNLGLQVMMGCMTESSVGISAIAHLLPLLDYVDMDGALLIANDPASGVRLEAGKAIFPTVHGLGVQLNTPLSTASY